MSFSKRHYDALVMKIDMWLTPNYFNTSNNLFYYSSTRAYTVFCPFEKSNFPQICVQNEITFENKKGLHLFWDRGNVHKTYEEVRELLETYESVQGREGVKNRQIWAYILFKWPPGHLWTAA